MDFFNPRNVDVERFLLDQYGSVENLINEAKRGNVTAQAHLGSAYSEGLGASLPQDLEKAVGWLKTAVDNGHATPYVLGKLGELLDREGTTLEHRLKAYEIYHRAAAMGSRIAQLNLAEIYRCGLEGVVSEDINEAFKWYKKAADEQDCGIDPELGTVAQTLAGTVRKMTNSLGGRDRALKSLYKYYLDGDCPEKRPQPTKAVHYLTRAAELGDTEAQRDLGRICLTGSCEQPKDVAKAKRWLSKAAAKGDVKAQQLLKECEVSDATEGSTPEPKEDSLQESKEIATGNLKQRLESQRHPFVISQPVALTEEMLSGFALSPTAKVYLQAYKLVKKGLKVLQSEVPDKGRGLSLIAYGYLTENSIFQAFPQICASGFITDIYKVCEDNLKANPYFFEGVLLAFALHPFDIKISEASNKADASKIMCMENLIQFILSAEPDGLPQKDPYKFDENYTSWLHVLYYHLATLYTIKDFFQKGAEAFDNSLKWCPAYYEAKVGLAYCFKELFFIRNESNHSYQEAPDSNLLLWISRKNISKFASWTAEKFKAEAIHLLRQFLEEAPVCYKNYPNACYHLAELFCFDNTREFKQYYELGQDAEEKRLPFFDPVDIPCKDRLAPMYQLFSNPPIRCGNIACSKKKSQLKSCACRTEHYCSKECQKADWKNHKASCTAVGQKPKQVTGIPAT